MSDILNFFANPQQTKMIRDDQYFPSDNFNLPPDGSSSSWTDARGNACMQVAPLITQMVQVTDDVLDSNGYYKVKKIDAWFGQVPTMGTELVCELRLDPMGDTLEVGDTCFAQYFSLTTGTPPDSGLLLLKSIVVGSPNPGTLTRDYTWISTQTTDYTANVNEAIPVETGVNGSRTVMDASNATPIVITTTTNHNLTTGNTVTVFGVTGNTNANVTANTVTVLSTTTFELDGTSGNAPYIAGGFVIIGLAPTITLPDWATSSVNDKVLIAVLQRFIPGSIALVSPMGSDNLNGANLGGPMNDSGVNSATTGSWGGTWEFLRSDSSAVGWVASRFIGT